MRKTWANGRVDGMHCGKCGHGRFRLFRRVLAPGGGIGDGPGGGGSQDRGSNKGIPREKSLGRFARGGVGKGKSR